MTELFFSDQTRVHFALARTEGLCGPVRYPDFAALWHEGRLGPLPQPEPFPDDLLLSLDLACGSIRGDPLSDERQAALRACVYCGDRMCSAEPAPGNDAAMICVRPVLQSPIPPKSF